MSRAPLADLALTYPEVGATSGPLPPAYHHLDVRRVVGQGCEWFDVAASRLLTWQVQRRAGVRVEVMEEVAPGVRAVLLIGAGPLQVRAPVEVVAVTAEDDRAGFAYGTLEGHHERGEERFEVAVLPDGSVEARVRAFSVPGRWFTRLAGPARGAAAAHDDEALPGRADAAGLSGWPFDRLRERGRAQGTRRAQGCAARCARTRSATASGASRWGKWPTPSRTTRR